MIFNASLSISPVRPTITITGPSISSIIEGNSFSLGCTVENSFPGLSITWLKDNELLVSSGGVEINTSAPIQNLTTLLYTTTSNLRIQQFRQGDAGIYTCRTPPVPPVNTILSSVSDSFTVTVQSKLTVKLGITL